MKHLYRKEETKKQSKFKEGQIVYHKELGNIEVFEIRSDNFDNDITLIVGNDDLRVSVWESDCIPVQEHKPESEENQQDLTFAIAEKLDDIFEFRYIGDDKMQYAYEVESRLRGVLDDLGFEITKKK